MKMLKIHLLEAKYEFLKVMRVPGFVVPTVLFPLAMKPTRKSPGVRFSVRFTSMIVAAPITSRIMDSMDSQLLPIFPLALVPSMAITIGCFIHRLVLLLVLVVVLNFGIEDDGKHDDEDDLIRKQLLQA